MSSALLHCTLRRERDVISMWSLMNHFSASIGANVIISSLDCAILNASSGVRTIYPPELYMLLYTGENRGVFVDPANATGKIVRKEKALAVCSLHYNIFPLMTVIVCNYLEIPSQRSSRQKYTYNWSYATKMRIRQCWDFLYTLKKLVINFEKYTYNYFSNIYLKIAI